jgi:hypothetical protein
MIEKFIALLTSQDTAQQLTERIKGNPRTTALAVVCAALFGCAKGLSDAGFVIASGLAGGVAALVAVVALLFASDGKQK